MVAHPRNVRDQRGHGRHHVGIHIPNLRDLAQSTVVAKVCTQGRGCISNVSNQDDGIKRLDLVLPDYLLGDLPAKRDRCALIPVHRKISSNGDVRLCRKAVLLAPLTQGFITNTIIVRAVGSQTSHRRGVNCLFPLVPTPIICRIDSSRGRVQAARNKAELHNRLRTLFRCHPRHPNNLRSARGQMNLLRCFAGYSGAEATGRIEQPFHRRAKLIPGHTIIAISVELIHEFRGHLTRDWHWIIIF
mmetsp:Transcript_2774/g.6737  ORF Transcript_2774/g.6737 Transcript_2774/m.6737 type:complete len:245 (+) Transcript_2774:1187-1921(+)